MVPSRPACVLSKKDGSRRRPSKLAVDACDDADAIVREGRRVDVDHPLIAILDGPDGAVREFHAGSRTHEGTNERDETAYYARGQQIRAPVRLRKRHCGTSDGWVA